MGGTLDSVAGSRVTSAFMSLSSSSSWFSTAMTTTNASITTALDASPTGKKLNFKLIFSRLDYCNAILLILSNQTFLNLIKKWCAYVSGSYVVLCVCF